MRRGRQLILWPLVAALLGMVAAALVLGAALLLIAVIPGSAEPWGDLGRLFVGFVLAVIFGLTVWLGGLVRAARHLFAPRQRLGVWIWSTVVIVVLAVVLAAVASLVDADSLGDTVGRGLLGGGFILMLAAPSGVFRLWDHQHRNQPSQL